MFSYVSLKWADFCFSSLEFTDFFFCYHLKSAVSSVFPMPSAVVSNSKLTFLGRSISIIHWLEILHYTFT